MNAEQRRICDGLFGDGYSKEMTQMQEQCERLEWELQATANALREAYAMLKMRRGAFLPPAGESAP